MSRVRGPHTAAGFIGLSLCAAAAIAACSDRVGFEVPNEIFEPDASSDAAPVAECLRQCSLDGRAVLDSCTGDVIETCSAELACGAGVCQAPCDAAAADRSSNGCEFYLQPPFVRESRSCYAAYVVNTSTLPVEVTLEIEGEKLDLSRSMFRTMPGDSNLVRHEGPIAPGDSVILFVTDLSPDESITGRPVKCPAGVVAATVGDKLPTTTGIGSSYHLTTTAPVSLAAIYPFGGAPSYIPSATLLLPVATWARRTSSSTRGRTTLRAGPARRSSLRRTGPRSRSSRTRRSRTAWTSRGRLPSRPSRTSSTRARCSSSSSRRSSRAAS